MWTPGQSNSSETGSEISSPKSLDGLPAPTLDYNVLQSQSLSVASQTSFSNRPTPNLELVTCRALRNARQPINILPAELLVDILMRLPSSEFNTTTTSPNSAQWFQCMAVCRHWRAIVASNGCFWRTIHTGEYTHWLQLALARSGEANLRLTFTRVARVISALPDLLPRRDHIERLDFLCQTDVRALAPLISAPLPCLTEFTMYGNGWDNSSLGLAGKYPDFVFQPENFLALVKLKLVCVSLRWTAPFLSRLRSLDLRNCPVPPAISCSGLLNVLWCGDNLEELILHDVLGAACSSGNLSPSPPADAVALPRLRKLDISDAPACIVEFMTYIQLPSNGDVTLTGQVEDPRSVSGLGMASMLPPNPDGVCFLRSSTSASLVMLEGMHWVVCEAPGPLHAALQLRARTPRVLWTQSLDDGLTQFTALFHDAPLAALTLQCELIKVAPDVLADALDAFPRLEELTATSSAFGPDPFPMHLCDSLRARPMSEWENEKDGGGARVRCASLKVLRLKKVRWEDGAFMNAVADCLRERERLRAPRLQLLAIIASRSPEVDWSEPDARFADILGPMVDSYEFSGKGW